MNNWKSILKKLNTGEIRSAKPLKNGRWEVNLEVKKAILEAFKKSSTIPFNGNEVSYFDKEYLLPQSFKREDNVRIVPSGTTIRTGSYVAPNVIIMPPSYINVGAYIGENSMVDSHVLVGSCAQIGENVHLSAGVKIGGVLEPIGSFPVIIENNAFIGAGSIIVEGIHIKENVVIAPGVVLSNSIPIYDRFNQCILSSSKVIPPCAVVVSGSRPIKDSWSMKHRLQAQCNIIMKYRDERTDSSLELESLLR